MKNLILLSILFLTSCAHTETKSSFITVDYLNCKPINKLFYKDQISHINSWFQNDDECSIVYQSVRIRKDLIVAFGERASTILGKEDEKDDSPRGPLKVEKINVMHCLIQLQSGKMKDINMTCEELEKQLK